MNDVERQEAIAEIKQELKQELFRNWKILFVLQLIIGGHAIYTLADTYPDIGLIQYALMLTIGAAITAAVLLILLVVLLGIIGAIFFGFSLWRERKNDTG